MKENHSLTRQLGVVFAFVAVMFCSPSAVYADEEFTGDRKIDRFIMRGTGDVHIILTQAHHNPDACTFDSHYILLKKDHPGLDQIVATLIAAKATNTDIDVGIDGCTYGWSSTSATLTSVIWK